MASMLRYELQGLDVVQRAYAQTPAVVNEEIKRFLEAVTLHLPAEVVDRAPTAFGQLRASIHGEVLPAPLGWTGTRALPRRLAKFRNGQFSCGRRKRPWCQISRRLTSLVHSLRPVHSKQSRWLLNTHLLEGLLPKAFNAKAQRLQRDAEKII